MHPPSSPSSSTSRPKHAAASHRPSLSTTMKWISASKPKPTRASESKLIDIIDHRNGVLGSGAQVVRTPEEALRDSAVPFSQERPTPELVVAPTTDNGLASPPLPPLPSDSDDEEELEEPARALLQDFKFPNVVPPLQIDVLECLAPPPFRPILLSNIPDHSVDRSKVVIAIETSTVTYKTTLETLTRSASHLSVYVDSLFPRPRTDSTTSSVYSTSSDDDDDDITTFRRHLASQGFAPQWNTPATIHIFLDRPSEPYAHILSYLRSPGSLPRAIKLKPASPARLEALQELREEAAFLDLVDLQKLCTEELERGQPRHTGQVSETTTLRNSDGSHYNSSDLKQTRSPRSAMQARSQTPPAGWI